MRETRGAEGSAIDYGSRGAVACDEANFAVPGKVGERGQLHIDAAEVGPGTEEALREQGGSGRSSIAVVVTLLKRAHLCAAPKEQRGKRQH